MIIEVLTLVATSVLAYAAIRISVNANRLTQNANEIAAQTAKLERDKHIVEWAQRVLSSMSLVVSLRQQGEIEAAEFKNEVRKHRANLYALHREGQVFFRSTLEPDAQEQAALAPIKWVADFISGSTFRPPRSNDYDSVRRPQYIEILKRTDIFVQDIQSRVGDHWTQ
jgi:hypothetical protein